MVLRAGSDQPTASIGLVCGKTIGGSGRVVSDSALTLNLADALASRGLTLRVSVSDELGEAIEAMRGADVAIVCGAAKTGEGADRPDLLLDQHELLMAIAERRAATRAVDGGGSASTSTTAPPLPPLVIAATCPGQLLTPWADGADAIAAAFYLGQAHGEAWARVLLGDVSPQGKLPVTFPASEEDTVQPCGHNFYVQLGTTVCEYSERLHTGWRGLIDRPVAFPFGHGLSYTTFNYSWVQEPAVSTASSRGDASVIMRVAIVNAGGVGGAEVAQLYVRFPEYADEPSLLLRDFAKTRVLLPGQSEVVELSLSALSDLSVWSGRVDEPSGGWSVIGGEFEALVGASSRDLRLSASFYT